MDGMGKEISSSVNSHVLYPQVIFPVDGPHPGPCVDIRSSCENVMANNTIDGKNINWFGPSTVAPRKMKDISLYICFLNEWDLGVWNILAIHPLNNYNIL